MALAYRYNTTLKVPVYYEPWWSYQIPNIKIRRIRICIEDKDGNKICYEIEEKHEYNGTKWYWYIEPVWITSTE